MKKNKETTKSKTQESNAINRRDFIATVSFVGAGLAASSVALAASQNQASAQTGKRNNTTSAANSSVGRRRLGKLEVSAVGLGVQNMSRKYETTVPYRPEMINIIRAAFDRGVTFFDAAEAYGPHEVERILGEGIAPFRDKVQITSKFGWNIDQQTGQRLPGLNSKPDHIKRVVDGMLRRLNTDRIDLLYQHRVDHEVPIEDVAGAVKDLMAQGKVLHWGLSEMGLKTLRRAHAALPVTAVQNEYSMLWRGPEKEVIPTCEELGIGFVPWSPLGVQFLTGWIDANTRFAPGDIRGVESRFSPENLPHNLALVDLVKSWAKRKEATPAQIALAWVLAQKPWIAPIPGTTKLHRLEENLCAVNVELRTEDLRELDNLTSKVKVQGARYSEGSQKLVNR
ncbi:MAG TPA: aldo/keto reductase [Blastocatellia bacterium]|nr:aldo/keto reductase [Blastocatellia bacterium]